MFLLREKFITQGEKRETSNQNLQLNNVSRQVEGFCILYFAEFIAIVHANSHATYVIYAGIYTRAKYVIK